jgi:hypothetical protein
MLTCCAIAKTLDTRSPTLTPDSLTLLLLLLLLLEQPLPTRAVNAAAASLQAGTTVRRSS